MILDRFASLIFIGDDMVRQVYAGLNVLLREDFALGALKGWKIEDGMERQQCSCGRQVTSEACRKYAVMSSSEAKAIGEGGGHGGGYYCERKDNFCYY